MKRRSLKTAAVSFCLITPGTAGLTIGHDIFGRQDCLSDAKQVG
jgi:hypothetical protein